MAEEHNLKVLFWPYRFADMKVSWADQMIWIANAFKSHGYEILRKDDFICEGMEANVYVPERDRNDIDYIVYNHTDTSMLVGNIVPAKHTLFMKPSVPTPLHTSLDTMGYGPYSAITYEKPDFEFIPDNIIQDYFDTKVTGWINNKVTKWNAHVSIDIELNVSDYYLVLGQCGGDSVVNQYDFGNYWTKLEAVIKELIRVDNRDVVVKLHPYTDGMDAKDHKFSENLINNYSAIDERVHVYNGKSNIHSFIPNARCVFLANSGAGLEVMMHHKPMVTWGYPEYHWVTYDLRHLADIKRTLSLDWFDRNKQDKFLHWYTEKYCYCDRESCANRVADILGKMAIPVKMPERTVTSRAIERQEASDIDKIDKFHRDRYEIAKKYCVDKDVLDIACGCGYGSSMLSEVAKTVTGFDISDHAVAYAKKHWQKDNISYDTADLSKELKLDKKFDTVVSFETIEHIDQPIKETLLKLLSCVKPGGHFICSFPLNERPEINSYHVHSEIVPAIIIKHIREFNDTSLNTASLVSGEVQFGKGGRKFYIMIVRLS